MTRFHGMTASQAQAYRSGAPDAYGNAPERVVSSGSGMPCRHCLRDVPAGQVALVLAHRPFATLQPYAETGPIFLCAASCAPADDGVPEVLEASPDYLVKGYGADERILYGTGQVTLAAEVPAYAAALLARPDVAFVDVRSARNNCWLARASDG